MNLSLLLAGIKFCKQTANINFPVILILSNFLIQLLINCQLTAETKLKTQL